MTEYTDRRRVIQLKVLANAEDAAAITAAAKAQRMTVSTYLLVAGLKQAADVTISRVVVVGGEAQS
jgi:uncharacterized protein (DUF1778 family)